MKWLNYKVCIAVICSLLIGFCLGEIVKQHEYKDEIYFYVDNQNDVIHMKEDCDSIGCNKDKIVEIKYSNFIKRSRCRICLKCFIPESFYMMTTVSRYNVKRKIGEEIRENYDQE